MKNSAFTYTPFFSLLIPVYNTQAYIARCLESCIAQSFKDIEILVIDDCGQDNAIEIAKDYASKNPRIQTRHAPRAFAYPIACLKSLTLHQKWQTYVRIALYFISFGRLKL